MRGWSTFNWVQHCMNHPAEWDQADNYPAPYLERIERYRLSGWPLESVSCMWEAMRRDKRGYLTIGSLIRSSTPWESERTEDVEKEEEEEEKEEADGDKLAGIQLIVTWLWLIIVINFYFILYLSHPTTHPCGITLSFLALWSVCT